RGFVRGAFRRSTYRSFRDEGSRRLALPAGAEPSDAIVPDLAFGLELPGPSAPGRGVVGIAPIVFESPRHWPVKDPVAYAGYTQRLAASLGALVAAGYRYRWLVSDLSDLAAVADVRALLSPDTARGEVSHPPITGVPDLIEALSSPSASPRRSGSDRSAVVPLGPRGQPPPRHPPGLCGGHAGGGTLLRPQGRR